MIGSLRRTCVNACVIMLGALSLNACGGGGDVAGGDDSNGDRDAERLGEQSQGLTPLLDQYPAADFPGAGTCINAALQGGFQTYYVATTGNDSNSGTIAAPLATLQGALNKLPATLDKDYKIVVRGGEYRGQSVNWNKVSATQRVHIVAQAGETPVFDGRAPGATATVLPWLLQVAAGTDVTSNVTISGLTVQYYAQIGLFVRGNCNRLYNNKVQYIGNPYARCYQREISQDDPRYGLTLDRPDCQFWNDPACKCEGYGAIDLMGASQNMLVHNDVSFAQNASYVGDQDQTVYDKQDLMHALYIAGSADISPVGSRYNLIQDNYIHRVSGTPVKFKAGSSNNRVIGNYLDRAGSGWLNSGSIPDNEYFFSDVGSPASINNVLRNNVATFPSENVTNALVNKATSFDIDAAQNSGKVVQGTGSSDEKIVATTVADVDNDGKPEVFAAINYPTLGFTKIVYSDGGITDPKLRSVAYSSNLWQITALTSGNFGAGTQVVAAFYRAASNTTQIATGGLVNGAYTFSGGTTLYSGSGSSVWNVSAMTAGKFGSDTTDKLITAAVVSGTQKIFRGDGVTSVSASAMPGVDNGSPLYSNANWRIPAMTNGKISGSTNSLITAFRWVGSSSAMNRIYLGDGVTSVTATQIFGNEPDKLITGLAFGKFNGTTARLAIGLDVAGVGKVYSSDGTTTNLLANKIYENQFWDITAMAAGRVDTDADDELVTAFDNSVQTELHSGDGTTLNWGATAAGMFYKNPD